MLRLFLKLIALGLLAEGAFAQVNSNTQTVTPNATLSETLTIAATPTTVNFTELRLVRR